MTAGGILTATVVPLGLGLLGFVEPCTVGSSMLFIKYVADGSPNSAGVETTMFTLTRAALIGALGAIAALAGPAVLPYQRVFWAILGAAYVLLGALYLADRQGVVMHRIGPALGGARRTRTAVGLGLLFGLNIPACATPLLAALFTASMGAASVTMGFWTLAVFGLALSLPLVVAVYSPRARATLSRVAAFSVRTPRWTGVAFVALGVWSIFVSAR